MSNTTLKTEMRNLGKMGRYQKRVSGDTILRLSTSLNVQKDRTDSYVKKFKVIFLR